MCSCFETAHTLALLGIRFAKISACKNLTQPDMDLYVHQPMLTYLGNKRKLVSNIENIVSRIRREHFDNAKIRTMDLFSGSGVVARALAKHSTLTVANDMEQYAAVCAKACIETPSAEDQLLIRGFIDQANALAQNGPYVIDGIIAANYAPLNTEDIQPGERCFFTRENALRIDTIRKFIDDEVPERLQAYILAPLLIKAGIHTNTSGHFQAFHKNDGIGAWGGKHASSLPRIKGAITLECPVWYSQAFEGCVVQKEASAALKDLENNSLDVIYLDPPYNQRQYSYLYFLFNIICKNKMPAQITDGGATVASERNDSAYCHKNGLKKVFSDMLELCMLKARFVIISYSNEGFLQRKDFDDILEKYEVELCAFDYQRYNVRGDETDATPSKTQELMYVISEKRGVKRPLE